MLPEDSGCDKVRAIFGKIAEMRMMGTATRQRKEYMTAAQCRLVRMKAREMGQVSIALEQAFAFELGVRQKDVIGEWIPCAWAGAGEGVWSPIKWMIGIRWQDIHVNLVLTHRLSKSLHSKDAVTDPEAGKMKAWDLHYFPMIMDDLRRIAGKQQVERSDLPTSGPLIVHEVNGRPLTSGSLRHTRRKIADAADRPANIQNRDSRPGAATEADVAGAPHEKITRQLGHSKVKTTHIYLREDLEVNRELARTKAEKRK